MHTEVTAQKGLLAGYCKDSGKEVHLPYGELPQHVAICGATGSGTSVLYQSLMKQQMNNGGGLLFIDANSNNSELKNAYQNACLAGRKNDFFVIDPSDPKKSNTYSPILFGDAQEISSRVMSLLPDTASAGADFYRTSAQQALETIISAFKCLGKPYNLTDLVSVFLYEKALKEIERRLLKEHAEATETAQFLTLLDRYKTANSFNMEKFKETLGGLAGRLYGLSISPYAELLNTYNPEVNLEQCILQSKIVYVKLPTFQEPKQAVALAKLIVADFRSAIARCQQLPIDELPKIPFMFHPNQCSAYLDASWSRLFEQARTSRIFATPSFQTILSLQPAGNEELSEIVMGNTKFKFFFKQQSLESATQSADAIGTYSKTTVADDGVQQNTQEAHIVGPEQINEMIVGECLLLVGGKELYKLRLPNPFPLDKTNSELNEIVLNHLPKNEVEGLNLSKFVSE